LYGKDWNYLAERMPSKESIQIRDYYYRIKKKVDENPVLKEEFSKTFLEIMDRPKKLRRSSYEYFSES